MVAGLEVVMQWIARKHDLLRDRPSATVFRWGLIGSLTPVMIFVLSIPIAFVSPTLAIVSWLLNLPVGALVSRRMPDEARDVLRAVSERSERTGPSDRARDR